jgi:hypothetical protein
MVFFKEELRQFQRNFFVRAFSALDTEKGMKYYCRDTFLGTKGIVPELDKDALARITHGLRVQYMFETKNKIGRWGIVDVPEALIDECAGRILAKVVVRRPLQAEEEARRQAARKAIHCNFAVFHAPKVSFSIEPLRKSWASRVGCGVAKPLFLMGHMGQPGTLGLTARSAS